MASTALSKRKEGLRRWAAEAKKTAARAETAKLLVRTAKAQLKKARKSSKAAKKAAKKAKLQLKAAGAKIKPAEMAAVQANTVRAHGSKKKTKAKRQAVGKVLKPVSSRRAAAPGRPRQRVVATSKPAATKSRLSAGDAARSVIKRVAVTHKRSATAPASPAKPSLTNGTTALQAQPPAS